MTRQLMSSFRRIRLLLDSHDSLTVYKVIKQQASNAALADRTRRIKLHRKLAWQQTLARPRPETSTETKISRLKTETTAWVLTLNTETKTLH